MISLLEASPMKSRRILELLQEYEVEHGEAIADVPAVGLKREPIV